MEAERWRLVRALFEQANELPATGWDAFLQQACADEGVRGEVLELLHADQRATGRTALSARAGELLDALAAASTRDEVEAELGRQFGAWKLIRPLGQGGMGAVYLAERVEGGFTQRAALKRARAGFDSNQLLLRLREERQILAGLEHPNIARLVDGGAGPGGEPFLALEYVEGENLRRWCDQRRLGIDARLRLFLTVCAAVSHAHARLVVHRDLKPSNILVTANGTVKLLDFGIAKLLDADRGAEATVARLRLFTPEYAAPEQVRGEPCTTAVDVYALGVLLYELLTGRRPYRVAGSDARAVEHAVLRQQPPPPSSVVTQPGTAAEDANPTPPETLAALRSHTPPRLRARLRGDLDAIVLTALRKAPEDRYASVRLLAADIEAHLGRRPVSARRGNRRYRTVRFLQRHATAVAFAALALGSFAAGTGVALWQAHEAKLQRDAAQAEAAKSEQALAFMQELFELSDPELSGGTEVSARELLGRGATRIRSRLQEHPAARAAMLRAIGEAHLGLGLKQQSLPLLEEAHALAASTTDLRLQRESARALARALHNTGAFQAAIDLLQPLLEDLQPHDRSSRLEAAALHYGVAMPLYMLGQYQRAEPHLRTALQLYEQLLGLADRSTQAVVNGYVALLDAQERHAEALPLAQRALDALDGVGDDPRRVDALSALAMAEGGIGNHARAEALRRENVQVRTHLYGPDHPHTLRAEGNLAASLFAQQRYGEAAELFERVLAGHRRRLPPGDSVIGLQANNAATSRLFAGDAQAALPLAEEGVRVRLAVFGPHNRSTGQSYASLGATLLELGRLDEAEQALQAALLAYEHASGPDSPTLVNTLGYLARVQLARAQAPQDCATSARALRLDARAGNSDRPDRQRRSLYLQGLHAACAQRLGEPAAATRLREAFSALRAVARDHDPQLRALSRLQQQLH